ncbi:MAG: DNA translocase FtsK 4TM domain-containing protein [Thalassobaculaceae bacterium]|nr:DNA translocase FtsK 4TM domain-containing protein [Thalassobaculaceae bacterium]
MARASGGNDNRTLLPVEATRYLQRRGEEAGGLALIAAAGLLAVTIGAYDPSDPSLNAAGSGIIAHPLGLTGAIVADLLLQSLGAASALLVLIPAVWGWRILRHESIGRWPLRIALLPLSMVLATAALALIAPPAAWPLRAGLGGFLGPIVLSPAGAFAPQLAVLGGLLPVAGLSGLLAVAAALWSAGMGLMEAGRGLIGLLRHTLSGAATGARIGARGAGAGIRLGARLGSGFGSGVRRFEPRLTPRGDDDADHADEDDLPWSAGAADKTPAPRQAVRAAKAAADRAPEPSQRRVEKPVAKAKPRAATQRQLDLGSNDGSYIYPELDLLTDPPAAASGPEDDALEQNARMLESVLADFGVKGTIGKVRYGPVVTLYELEPAPGTKSSRVIGLSDDIARSMSAVSVRVAVVPGRNVIGIELPNARRETVYFRDVLESDAINTNSHKLAIALGKDIGGTPIAVDLARMPHLLIAGTTGSGKSVAVNTMILSLLYRLPPERCRFIMIDPKMLELSVYDGIPHLLSPVVTDPKKAVVALKWTVREMESRYRAMSKLGVRNIDGYNARIAEAVKKGEVLKRRVQTGFDADSGKPVFEEEPLDLVPLPYIVVVIDEVADLMLVAGKDIEGAVQRLAQMARAAGIHVIMATQRPSVDVITGTIKANFPTRISFQVTSKIDSRTILGEQGAEQLLGMGDMLYMAGGGRITRVHGPFCSDEEVEDVVRHLKTQGEPEYDETITEDDEGAADPLGFTGAGEGGGSGDDLYDQAVAIVAREGKASTSFIQRHLKIGYNRAATLIERMESEGVVSQANHVGKREVLVGDHSAA